MATVAAIPKFHVLRLDALALQVRLGVTKEERAIPQEVRVTVELRFPEAPLAMNTDKLEDTIDYGDLAEAIRSRCEGPGFHLIEKMSQEIYAMIRAQLLAAAEVGVWVHKVRPPVEGLTGGSRFYCGDFPA